MTRLYFGIFKQLKRKSNNKGELLLWPWQPDWQSLTPGGRVSSMRMDGRQSTCNILVSSMSCCGVSTQKPKIKHFVKWRKIIFKFTRFMYLKTMLKGPA